MNWPPNRSWMKIKFAERFMHTLGTSIPVAPKSGKNPYDQNKETSPEEDYGGIAISFNNALQRLEDYGMSRRDLHGNNYMMRSDGHLVISDPGIITSTTTGIKESFFRKNIKSSEIWLNDEKKKNVANENGYEVLYIWDSEFSRVGKENKNKIIDKCIKFLRS